MTNNGPKAETDLDRATVLQLPRKKGRRLTGRQLALLARVERLGRATVEDLGATSAVARRLETLVARGLLKTEGDPRKIYWGRPESHSPSVIECCPWLRDFEPYWFLPADAAEVVPFRPGV